jgi:hypothetical protein
MIDDRNNAGRNCTSSPAATLVIRHPRWFQAIIP